MAHLWSANTAAQFWRCQPDPTPDIWAAAVRAASPVLDLPTPPGALSEDTLLERVLGEGQFGPDHWTLSRAKRWYYRLKPLLPRPLTRVLRRVYGTPSGAAFPLAWPVDDRYARYQWAVLRHVLAHLQRTTGRAALRYTHFWPDNRQFALVLTHDIETAAGQDWVRRVADLETGLGFRSSFNFVPERYPLDTGLIAELRRRGFEVGVHGLTHDGRLFESPDEFARRAARINTYLRGWRAAGFRSPCTLRHPAWMQQLDIEYDSSFFDTDPYEPLPGGTLALWPFFIGRFVELPYTLVQDYTLTAVLGHTTPRLWLEKVDVIASFGGLALLNTHPDYLRDPAVWAVYEQFLAAMQPRSDTWLALPRTVARWWRTRHTAAAGPVTHTLPGGTLRQATLTADGRLDLRAL